MACPHVAGVAALILQRNPELTVTQVNSIICRNAKKLSNANLNLKPGATLQIMNGGIIETQHGFKAPVGVKVEISHGRIL